MVSTHRPQLSPDSRSDAAGNDKEKSSARVAPQEASRTVGQPGVGDMSRGGQHRSFITKLSL